MNRRERRTDAQPSADRHRSRAIPLPATPYMETAILTLFGRGRLRAWLVVATLIGFVRPAAAQWFDAQNPTSGELLVGLTGMSTSVDERFGPDGSTRSLADVFSFTIDDRIVPGLDTLDARLSELFAPFDVSATGESTLGRLKFDVLFERTSAPLSLAYGVTDWLTVFGVLPIVKTRSFSGALIEDGTASAVPIGAAFGGAPDALLDELDAGIAGLQSIVDAGDLSPDQQQTAEQLLADARAMQSGLQGLRGLPFVPTDSSAAGRQISAAYEGIRSGFAEFHVQLPALLLGTAISGAEAAGFITESEFGVESPRRRSTGIKFGDIELGVSLQPLNSYRGKGEGDGVTVPLRLKLEALWRFPSGSPPIPERLTDAGTGDGQADLELRSALDIGFGDRIWLSLFGAYTLQFEGQLERLLTDLGSPIQLGARTAPVSWDPGDVMRVAVLPRFNFTPNITFSGLFMLTEHGRDDVTLLDPTDDEVTPDVLEEGTEFTSSTVGFAARLASTEWHGSRRAGIPVEVELRYLRTVSARDGLVPQRNVWEVGLRYYRPIFR